VDILNDRAKMVLSLLRGKPVENAPTEILLKHAIDECLNNKSSYSSQSARKEPSGTPKTNIQVQDDGEEEQPQEQEQEEEEEEDGDMDTSSEVECLLIDNPTALLAFVSANMVRTQEALRFFVQSDTPALKRVFRQWFEDKKKKEQEKYGLMPEADAKEKFRAIKSYWKVSVPTHAMLLIQDELAKSPAINGIPRVDPRVMKSFKTVLADMGTLIESHIKMMEDMLMYSAQNLKEDAMAVHNQVVVASSDPSASEAPKKGKIEALKQAFQR
jgi:hypothetical protein